MLFLAKIAFSHDEKKFSVAKVNNVHTKNAGLDRSGTILGSMCSIRVVLCYVPLG